MIKREYFVNKLRELGFAFNRQADRVDQWRQRGTGRLISVPRRDLIPEIHVALALKQCGCDEEEIKAFIASAKT
jgi:hypothetical protein